MFNRGRTPFDFTATAGDSWIRLSAAQGTVEKELRLWVSVDWDKAPKDVSSSSIKITQAGADAVTVKVNLSNPEQPVRKSVAGFVEADGCVSIEAEHYTKKTDAASARWEKIPDYGRTLSAMTIFPVTAQSVTPPQDSPCLEYQMYLFDPDKVEVEAIIAPTLNYVPDRGLRFAIAFDDQPPQIIDALEHRALPDWEISVKDNVRKVKSTHTLTKTGYHTLKFWMVDPGVVLEKLVVNLGGVKPSYLGPPESFHNIETASSSKTAEMK